MTSEHAHPKDCNGRIDNAEEITAELVDAMDVPDEVGDAFTDLVGCMADEIDTLESENDALREENAELNDRVDELEEQPDVEITDDNDPVGSLEIDNAPIGKVLTAKADKSDVEWCEEEIEELSTEDTTTDTPGTMDDLTPVEQLARAGDPDDVTESQSVKRAVSLFQNIAEWGSKTPKGYVLRPQDNPVALLEADRDESLSWKQYYRAAETLEQLSKGSITFFDSDKHGKMLVLHERSDAFDRVQNGSLTPSSVGVTG